MPLASQLILMPNGAVAAVQQEVPSAQSPGVHADADQVSGSIDLWTGTGEDEGNDHRLRPTLLPRYHFSGFFFFFCFLPLISIELEFLTTFELLELGRFD